MMTKQNYNIIFILRSNVVATKYTKYTLIFQSKTKTLHIMHLKTIYYTQLKILKLRNRLCLIIPHSNKPFSTSSDRLDTFFFDIFILKIYTYLLDCESKYNFTTHEYKIYLF